MPAPSFPSQHRRAGPGPADSCPPRPEGTGTCILTAAMSPSSTGRARRPNSNSFGSCPSLRSSLRPRTTSFAAALRTLGKAAKAVTFHSFTTNNSIELEARISGSPSLHDLSSCPPDVSVQRVFSGRTHPSLWIRRQMVRHSEERRTRERVLCFPEAVSEKSPA